MHRRLPARCAPALTFLLGACASASPPPLEAPGAPPSTTLSADAAAGRPPVAGPSSATPAHGPSAESPPPLAPVALLEAGDHGFAARLYASRASAEAGNLILSPASARIALGMAYLGARGDTARELGAALGLVGDERQAGAEMAASVKAWTEQRDPKVKLAVANALYGQRGWPIEDAYASALKSEFAARLQIADFAGDPIGATRAINGFVASHTSNQIAGVVQEGDLTPQTRLALVNATYFKGEWKTAFPPGGTVSGIFHAPAHDVAKPLMHVEGYFGYGETPDAEVLAMAYGSGAYAMVVVLPKTRLRLAALERRMTGAAIDAWFASAKPSKVNVTIPRFEAETRSELGEALAGMGVRQAFDPGLADFSGMSSAARIFLSKVIQKAKVKVDEKGTVAVAATVVGVRAPPSAPPPVPAFTADRPFLYFIRDELGNVLFVGRVVEP